MPDKKNRVVLIGRPNTGKSTLFNNILNQRKAITSAVAGTTRDINTAECEWQGINFLLIDTAGLKEKIDSSFEENIQTQANLALEQADIIIFVVDIRTGPTPQEINLAKKLQKKEIPVLLAINKAEGKKWRDNAGSFNSLGFDSTIISSIKGIGVGDILDKITENLKKSPKSGIDEDFINVGIFGRPNAGKSSIFNRLAGEEKVIVSEIPGTTRDAIDIKLEYKDDKFIFYDTAGIKRRTKTKGEIETFSISRSIQVIKKIDIALFILDISEAITKQDLKIINKLTSFNKGVIIIANKWDKIINKINPKDLRELEEKYQKYLQYHLRFIYWAPVIFVSAKTGTNIEQILPTTIKVNKERSKVITSEKLAKFIHYTYRKNPPPRLKKKNPPKFKKFIQVGINPPIFKLFIKANDTIQPYYIKYIEKELRKTFGFDGTGIKILISK